jgi:hypothetical protein
LHATYPDPPRLILLSNNEHPRLRSMNATKTRGFVERFGSDKSPEETRRIFGDGWIERYGALIDGLRSELPGETWRREARFVAYSAFGPKLFGVHDAWFNYCEYSTGRIAPWPYVWQGGSPPFYMNPWDDCSDEWYHSPQVDGMCWVFMAEDVLRDRPEFWFELSFWDGSEPRRDDDKRKTFAAKGFPYTPERHGGLAQFALWMLRPRLLREFRASRDTLADYERYFLPLADGVDRVYRDETLKRFWRKGRLVPNRAHRHPNSSAIPAEYANRDRWFRLDASTDPPKPWSPKTDLKVFALALSMGETPNREWLVYAHSPRGEMETSVTIPEFRAVPIKPSPAGRFFLVRESSSASSSSVVEVGR